MVGGVVVYLLVGDFVAGYFAGWRTKVCDTGPLLAAIGSNYCNYIGGVVSGIWGGICLCILSEDYR